MGGDELGALKHNDSVIDSLGHTLTEGEAGLKTFPGLLKRCLREGCWRRRFVRRLNRVVMFERFEAFLATAPLEGLGADLRAVQNLCRDDTEALDLIDRETKGRQGARTDIVDNIHEVKRPSGTSQAAALRRLRKSRPDLHAQVVAKKKTAHAAMLEAGFRKKPSALEAAKKAAAKLTATERKQLLAWLARPG